MYVRRTSEVKATNDSVQASRGVTRLLRASRSIRESTCVVSSAFLRKQWSGCHFSNPEGSLTAAQHVEPGDFTFRNRFSRAAAQEVGCGEEREAQPYEPIIDHTKQSWYFSNATSALTSSAELNRSYIYTE
ncbi:Hypothetical_protein [Hexamita inflata]|uniref:Hypothetical_protein n=1 Tax=Hexamita inflata TaxID=28002 RepID=A0AA86UJ24_9EUKA|nr:Hypothetical protein HINF_LOCUS47865 [Hexamita inflata]